MTIIQHDSGPVITRKPSAVAMAARIVDVASHIDDAGAEICAISCATYHRFDTGTRNDVVRIQTDGPGFLALVDHFELRTVCETGGTIDGYGEIGPFDQRVHVFAGLAAVLAAGLVLA